MRTISNNNNLVWHSISHCNYSNFLFCCEASRDITSERMTFLISLSHISCKHLEINLSRLIEYDGAIKAFAN